MEVLLYHTATATFLCTFKLAVQYGTQQLLVIVTFFKSY